MTNIEDVTRIKHNIKILEDRIKKLLAGGPENGAIDTLERELFYHRRMLMMTETEEIDNAQPINMPVMLDRVYKKLGYSFGFGP